MLLKGDNHWIFPFSFAPFFTPPVAGGEKQQCQCSALHLSQLWAATGTEEGAKIPQRGKSISRKPAVLIPGSLHELQFPGLCCRIYLCGKKPHLAGQVSPVGSSCLAEMLPGYPLLLMDNVQKEFLLRVITVKCSQELAVVVATCSWNFNWCRKRSEGKEEITF